MKWNSFVRLAQEPFDVAEVKVFCRHYVKLGSVGSIRNSLGRATLDAVERIRCHTYESKRGKFPKWGSAISFPTQRSHTFILHSLDVVRIPRRKITSITGFEPSQKTPLRKTQHDASVSVQNPNRERGNKKWEEKKKEFKKGEWKETKKKTEKETSELTSRLLGTFSSPKRTRNPTKRKAPNLRANTSARDTTLLLCQFATSLDNTRHKNETVRRRAGDRRGRPGVPENGSKLWTIVGGLVVRRERDVVH